MKNKHKIRCKFFRFIVFMKHAKNNTLNSFKKKTKEFTVFKKEVSEFRINGKDTVAMLNIDYLKRHGSSTVNRVLSSAGWTESTVTTKRNKFKSIRISLRHII